MCQPDNFPTVRTVGFGSGVRPLVWEVAGRITIYYQHQDQWPKVNVNEEQHSRSGSLDALSHCETFHRYWNAVFDNRLSAR